MAASSGLDPLEADAWERDEPGEFKYEDVSREEAGRMLGAYLMYLKNTHQISAVSCCIAAFWALKAGACGIVSDLALPPGKLSHEYSRHFDKKVGVMKKSSFYPFKIPQNIRMSVERQLETVYSQPLQDAFQKMVEVMEDARRDLEVGIAEERQRLCDAICSHYRTCKRLRIPSKPKHHFLMELVVRCARNGPLALMATWPDEGLNRVIKNIGQTAHRLNWSHRVLDDFEAAHRLGPQPSARKRKFVS